jgi:single-strand DNA-binding protein
MFNQVTLCGNLGRDPEIRTMSNGNMVANLNVATTEKWKDKGTGEKKEKTEWHRIVVFNKFLIPICEQYLKKGSLVFVQGKLTTRKWQKDGRDIYVTEILLDHGGTLRMLGGGEAALIKRTNERTPEALEPGSLEPDDDIPL